MEVDSESIIALAVVTGAAPDLQEANVAPVAEARLKRVRGCAGDGGSLE